MRILFIRHDRPARAARRCCIRPVVRLISRVSFVLALGVAVSDVYAAKVKKTKGAWTRKVEAGVNLTEGNKDSVQARAQIEVKNKRDKNETLLKLRGEIGETDSERTRERVNAEAAHRRELSLRSYVSLRAEFLYDGIAELDYRVVASPSFGYFLIRDEAQEFRAETGPAGVWEKKAGARDAYPALRVAEYYECKLTAVSQLKQGIEFVPELKDEDDGRYLTKAFLELKMDMDEQVSVKLRLESDYDSRPAEGKNKQDTSFSVTLAYAF